MVQRKPIQSLLVQQRKFMLRVARDICSPDLAEDAVQDASLRALQSPPEHDVALQGWLRRVVINSALQLLRSGERRRHREHAVARPEALIPKDDASEELRLKIDSALDSLREPYRKVLVLKLKEGLTNEAICEHTGLCSDTVKSQVRRRTCASVRRARSQIR